MNAVNLAEGHLHQTDIDRYWEEGFLFPLTVMSEAEAASGRRAFETLEAEWTAAGKLPRPFGNYCRLNAHYVMPFAAEIASRKEVLDVIEGILGPDILIYSVEFMVKEKQSSKIITMHQDLTYWGLGATSEMVTAWIALSPATLESGCMEFVSGSHKNPIMPHHDTFDENNMLSRGQEIAVEIAPEDRTTIALKPGQMSLHHGLMIHGSGPNVSDDRRIGVAIRYVTPRVSQEVASTDYAMLVRGQDEIGNFIHVTPPQAPFSPDAMARYDAIRDAQASATMDGVTDKKFYS
ncbi:MAG: phytanoyl-CoA dioxygenase family protein [Candidatus Puniceispirillales bacterium]